MYFIRLLPVLFTLIFFSLTAFGQSNTKLKGIVIDSETRGGIAGATLRIDGTAYSTFADELGNYRLEQIPPGIYTLLISSVGYKTKKCVNIEILPDITVSLIVKLESQPHYLGSITVTESREMLSADKVNTIERNEIEKSHARDIPEILENIEGVYVQKTGISGSRSEIKIRGGSAEHVLVLIDGQKINPSGTGTADLSTIPLEMVEKIEIYKGGASAEFGPDALSGAVNITTRKDILDNDFSAKISQGWGKWDAGQSGLNTRNPIRINSLSYSLTYSQNQSSGNFPFEYSVQPSNKVYAGERLNNSFDEYNYFTSGLFRINNSARLNWSAQLYRNRRGMPDRASLQNETAYTTDRRKLLSVGYHYTSGPAHSFDINISLSRFTQHFLEPDTTKSLFYRFDSQFENDIYTLSHNHHLTLWNGFGGRVGVEFRRDALNHTDDISPYLSMNKTVRNNSAVYLSAEQLIDISMLLFADNLSLTGALRYDWSRTRKDSTSYRDTVTSNSVNNISPKIGAAVSKGTDFSYTIRGSYGKSFRLPSLNALFWKGDVRASGNPGLKPERSEHSEAGLELRGKLPFAEISGGMTYFHSAISDLIVWLPLYGGWRPVNRDRAQITGHEDYVNIELLNGLLELQYNNCITTPLNKSQPHTVYDKQLVFSPHYVTTYTLKFDTRCLYGSYSIRKCDSVFTLEANTKYYPAYRVDDLHLGAKYTFKSDWQISADMKIYNIRDMDYVLMTHYPMPGREWHVGISLRYGLGDKY